MIAFAFGAGILTSVVGVGGGIIYTPLLLELGAHPKVAAGTSIFL